MPDVDVEDEEGADNDSEEGSGSEGTRPVSPFGVGTHRTDGLNVWSSTLPSWSSSSTRADTRAKFDVVE